MRKKFLITDATGHKTLDVTDHAMGQAKFDELMETHIASKKVGNDQRLIRSYDETNERTLFTSKLQGG